MTAIAKVSTTLLITTALSFCFATARPSTAFAHDQDEMNRAIVQLQQARISLEHAADDKGGHRLNAIHMIDKTIREVEAGKAYAKAHPEHH
jgi:hypothetical protein